MQRTPRIGVQIDHAEPYWVQVREAIKQQGLSSSVEIVEISIPEAYFLSANEQVEVVEDLVVQDLDALICNAYPQSLVQRLLDRGFPVVFMAEHELRHPRFVSRTSLYDAAALAADFLDARLPANAEIFLIGGERTLPLDLQRDGEDSGQSRVDGFLESIPAHRMPYVHHIPCLWARSYEEASKRLASYLQANPYTRVDAIFGISDSLALGAQHAAQQFGRLHKDSLLVGLNGDPLALAAISTGQMTATIEVDLDDLAANAFDMALRATRNEPLPVSFQCRQGLTTAENVVAASTRKLISLANLPNRLIEDKQHHEQQRILQAETSAAIDRKVGLLLDEQQLSLALTSLIRDSYGFDHARFMQIDAAGRLISPREEELPDCAPAMREHEADSPLDYAQSHNQLVFIPNTTASHRFPPSQRWPKVLARVIVPVRLGGQLIGLLDLHHYRVTHHTREELAGLQLLADRFGITLRNAQLYSQEQAARALAEQADRMKTTLLANVNHELRTPLNVILGYSQGSIEAIARNDIDPAELTTNLGQIFRSGEHLLRLINDLLDLSRAEIGELDLVTERIALRSFLEEVFRSSAEGLRTNNRIAWQLVLPPRLPSIDADPVRLRQILLNLLHNAYKFTERGSITLGADTAEGELHLWVADTGIGIAPELCEQIFEPFVSGSQLRPYDGIGLGLSITRRLVALHQGRLSLESEPDVGSVFHIYLPLATEPLSLEAPVAPRRALLLISEDTALPEPMIQLAERRGLALHLVRADQDVSQLLQTLRPALLAWDVATTADDGWRVVEELRSRAELRQLPVLIYGNAPEIAAQSVGGATGVLLKPLGDELLLEAISDLDPNEQDGSILIVEDDPHIRTQHRQLLAKHFPNYTIRDAGDGQAALAAIAQSAPSLIMLDLIIPEPDGFAILESLRSNRRTANIPVLVLSGKALSHEDIRRLSAARVIFQSKDMLTHDELSESLRRAIDAEERLPLYTSALVKQAIAFIQQQHAEPLSRQAIADAVGVHKDYLGRIFQHEVGLTPWEYLVRYRLLQARALLHETDLTVAEIAMRVGFETPSYFSQAFNRKVGCSPRAYRVRQRSAAALSER